MEKVKWFFFGFLVVLAVNSWKSWQEEQSAKERMEQEEQMILQYLEEEGGESRDMEQVSQVTDDFVPETWEDTAWFRKDGVTYTPEYAKGALDCVLEIEEIRLRRGIYIGTREEMLHNLEVWMLTAARSDYRLGETHYCVYGHNCVGSGQEISMNRLQELSVGDTFTLITPNRKYGYEVVDIYGMGREEVTRRLVDNFALPSDRCYLITCGRGQYRYLDLVVEGVLTDG